MVEKNVALVRRWFEEVWNQQKGETIRELMAAECVAHGTSETGGDLHGPEGFLELHARLLEAFPDMHIEVQDAFGSGDMVAVRWVGSLLYQTSVMDPLAVGCSILMLLMAAATAAIVPARRAASTDPIHALRAE